MTKKHALDDEKFVSQTSTYSLQGFRKFENPLLEKQQFLK